MSTIGAGANIRWRAVLAHPGVRERLNNIGLEVMGTGTPEGLSSFQVAEIGKWAKWVKDAGIKPEWTPSPPGRCDRKNRR